MLYSEFVECVNHFIEISDRINDGWTVRKYKDYVYLSKCVTQRMSDENIDLPNDLEDFSVCQESDDQAVDDPPLNFRKWEYHILHSISYQVPVVYFNVWNSSGQLLSLEEVWEAIHPNFKSGVLNNKWFTLTQQEHPYLFKPFYYFHPCQTEEFLKVFPSKKCNMLITWLSSIGQVIWLNLSHEYGKNCFLMKE